ncbi:undecaprenyldiphospho-muramoylpentapeptide beta-N-acetylglucosaminyltransferase [uncultured Desulfovibrio sp.]|uniref:undecaprenyldiphospho-muramoylpentapeptide beta-N-acetylglucosaminyltransferase n=1 Tax=uncultured Desulfovibrio sp. TaxID=167968 RepID=UPI00260F1625|nr:undecaprenyldiphospho-muramoylpentapeptide beta-N-acetylglucosaminyltransferase [uncultured Desulfovibrio sp.]
MERLLLTTGGTGGHIFPALAVAEALRRENPQARILFVGSDYGPEARLAAAAGLEFAGLPVRGLVGRGLRAVSAAARMAIATGRALAIVRRFRPQVVAGFGGYAAFAPMLAGRCLGVPCVLHEQNAIPGASNRLLARLARRVCLSLPVAEGFPREKCVLTGNPVRAAVAAVGGRPRDFSGRRLLIMGGSQGAHALNLYVMERLDLLRRAGVEVRHQTGKADYEAVRAAYADAGFPDGCVSPFIDDMAAAYAWADLAFCRAGATTVAELCAAGLPAVLVPFPHAAHDHQRGNAEALSRVGAARWLPEDRMREEGLLESIIRLLDAPEERRQMADAARRAARPQAAEAVCDVLEGLCRT